MFGLFGLTSMIDSLQRAIFYPVLRSIRLSNNERSGP